MPALKQSTIMTDPYSSFLAIHFEVGGDTESLEHQRSYWPVAIDFVDLANQLGAKLTMYFNPQWAEYILKDPNKLNLLKHWQSQDHEIGIHHHGYDHGDWNGYTNRKGKEDDPKYRGNMKDMIKLMEQLLHPYKSTSGTITDEKYDYPVGLSYDTQGIRVSHARSKPKQVLLGRQKVIQVGMGLLSCEGNLESLKHAYNESESDEILGVVTHEHDYHKNPSIIKDWFKFIETRRKKITTVSQIITKYQEKYTIEYSGNPLTFLNNVKTQLNKTAIVSSKKNAGMNYKTCNL